MKNQEGSQKSETTTHSYPELLRNLKDTKQIMKELDIKIVIDGGALLGAYREGGKPIEGDEDDVDFLLPFKYMQRNATEIYKAFRNKGFELHRLRDTVMTFKRDGVKIDLLFYKEDGIDYYITLYHNKRPFALLIPKKFLRSLDKIKFLGEEFLAPKEIEDYLEWRFGDWRTPILRPNFGFQNYLNKPHLTKYLNE